MRGIAFVCLAAVATMASADMELTYNGGETVIVVSNGRAAMGSAQSQMLYKSGSPDITIVDHQRREFTVLDQQAVAGIQRQQQATMANERGICLSGFRVPKPSRTVETGRSQSLSIRGEGDLSHWRVMSFDDTALLASSRARLAEFCDGLTVREVAGADHWILHTHPRTVAEHMRAFLASSAPRAR